ncbi:MAG: hypothetical protein WD512_12850 [Candidatus Paceibacterota bacterium]
MNQVELKSKFWIGDTSYQTKMTKKELTKFLSTGNDIFVEVDTFYEKMDPCAGGWLYTDDWYLNRVTVNRNLVEQIDKIDKTIQIKK